MDKRLLDMFNVSEEDFKYKSGYGYNCELDEETKELIRATVEEENKKIEKDEKYNLPISKRKAYEIAQKNENLKTDYFRKSGRGYLSYISFIDEEIELVEINNKKYWQIQILGGNVSGIEDTEDGGTRYWDGFFGEDDLRKLRCLIDTETGEYIYYPSAEKIKKRKFPKFGGLFKWKK